MHFFSSPHFSNVNIERLAAFVVVGFCISLPNVNNFFLAKLQLISFFFTKWLWSSYSLDLKIH